VIGTVASLFLFAFGALGVWLLRSRFPHAYFMQACYAAMSLGGLVATGWTVSHNLVLGVIGVAILFVGCIIGLIGGVVRRELRIFPPP